MTLVSPQVRNNVCLTAHPGGIQASVRAMILRAESKPVSRGPKKILVIGCSGGYGLALRIASAFSCGAATVGVSFERPGTEKKPGSPGFYANRVFAQEAATRGLRQKTVDGDAFSEETKAKAAAAAAEMGGADLVVYSIASGVRTDQDAGKTWRSALKPVGKIYEGLSLDLMSGMIHPSSVEPATEEEILSTVKVMGGEDWKRWIEVLIEAKALSRGAETMAFSYIGPERSRAIYREGTIGKAKEDLERTAREIGTLLRPLEGSARIAVLKALITRASAVIPGIALYIGTLFRVMKDKGLHEDTLDQALRLISEKLPRAEKGETLRLDDYEMRDDVQAEVSRLMDTLNPEDLVRKADLEGLRNDFLRVHGFEVEGVDYGLPVDFD